MSTPGRIFREQIFTLENTTDGEKTIDFHVDNDGFILFIEKMSGEADVLVDVQLKLPDDISDVSLEKVMINGESTFKKAYVGTRQGRLKLSWTDSCDIKIAIKTVSAAAVPVFNEYFYPSTETTEATKFRVNLLSDISYIQQLQQVIANQLRQISEVNDEEGDEF